MEISKKRDISIDIMKALAIFCMVAGHSEFPFTHFIYLFHVAVFFIASGYFYKDSNSMDLNSVIQFIKRKFSTLWFMYVLWTTIYSMLHNLFIKIHIYTDNPIILENVSGAFIKTTDYWSKADIAKNIIKSFVFAGGTQIGGAFWFIANLMEISVGYVIIDSLLNYIFKRSLFSLLSLP